MAPPRILSMHSHHPARIPAPLAPAIGNAMVVACVLGAIIGAAGTGIVAVLVHGGAGGGGALGGGTLALYTYAVAVCAFHILEFYITAHYNPTRLYDDSFLLQNGAEYLVAHCAGLAEHLLEMRFAPQLKTSWAGFMSGLMLVVAGQALRTLAMVHSGSNFSHRVAVEKRADHELVRTGIYGMMRHPSYAGFYCWAIGTQVMLGNPLVALGFALKLHSFFSTRISDEEQHLERFFGEAYVRYRRDVRSGVPLVR